jgi:hypothetical protein
MAMRSNARAETIPIRRDGDDDRTAVFRIRKPPVERLAHPRLIRRKPKSLLVGLDVR